MVDFQVREAQPTDAAGIIAHIKRIGDEPNNGIAISSADEFLYTEEEETSILARAAGQDDLLFLVAIADGQIIGVANCGTDDGGYRHTYSLGISVRREWRGQGLGTAMMQYMIDWCQTNPLVHRLELWVFADNSTAIRLYEHLGFEREGTRRESFLKDGGFKDLVLMGMLLER